MSGSGEAQNEELSLADYLTIIKRRWLWVLIPSLIGLVFGVYQANKTVETFTSSAQVLVGNSAAQETLDPTSRSISFLSRELSNEIALARSDSATQRVRDELGFVPAVSIFADDDSDQLVFRATARAAADAASFANTWANVYVEVKQSEAAASLTSAVDQFQERLEGLRTERQQIREPLDELQDEIAIEQRTADQLIRESRTPDLLPRTTARQDQLQRDFDRLSDDLQPELNLVDTEITAVSRAIIQLELDSEVASTGTARVVRVATEPSSPNGTGGNRNVVLAAIVGAICGVGLALLRDSLDRTIKSQQDITATVQLPVLTSIPMADRQSRRSELALVFDAQPDGPVAGGYQKLRTALQFAAVGDEIGSVLITSASQSEGKTTTSSNLAWAMAAVGKQTVLADIDFRRPRLDQVYGIDLSPGLSDSVLNDTPLTEGSARVGSPDSSLIVIPAGTVPPSPGDFLGTASFLSAFEWLCSGSDLVILDAPPVLPVSDALAMVSHVDAVMLTVMAGSTTRDELASATQLIRQAGGRLVGVVLIGAKSDGSYGQYEYKTSEAKPRQKKAGQKVPNAIEMA